MNSTIKKILQFFVGIFYIGRDKTKEVVNNLKQEGVFSEEESRDVVNTTVDKTKKKVKTTSKQVKSKVDNLRKKDMPVEQVEDLENSVKE